MTSGHHAKFPLVCPTSPEQSPKQCLVASSRAQQSSSVIAITAKLDSSYLGGISLRSVDFSFNVFCLCLRFFFFFLVLCFVFVFVFSYYFPGRNLQKQSKDFSPPNGKHVKIQCTTVQIPKPRTLNLKDKLLTQKNSQPILPLSICLYFRRFVLLI